MMGESMKNTKKENRIKGTIILVLFLLIMVSGFIFTCLHLKELVLKGGREVLKAARGEISLSEVPANFESYYDSLYSSKPWTLDAFSLSQRILNKKETRNFEVLRSDNGSLYLGRTTGTQEEEDLDLVADQYEIVYEKAKSLGGEFLFVQAPVKNPGQAQDLKAYHSAETEAREDALVKLLKERNIPSLDLRDYPECREYYNTDHHWTVKAAFDASRVIEKELGRPAESLENYREVTYEDSFLGSMGIKVGPYFGGMDDFTIYMPDFPTDFTLKHYVEGKRQLKKSGDFKDVFVDWEVMDNPAYKNKYDAILSGAYVEVVIENHMAKNDRKCLLIGDSYGRPLAQYMSMGYKELRFLDPQRGRFNENLLDYINEYKPDVVVLMYNGRLNIGDGNWED